MEEEAVLVPVNHSHAQREGICPRGEHTVSRGARTLEWAPVSPRHPKGRTLLRRVLPEQDLTVTADPQSSSCLIAGKVGLWADVFV